jgi:hypothetical protein
VRSSPAPPLRATPVKPVISFMFAQYSPVNQ